MAPKVLFGGFLVTVEVLMLEIDDLWVTPLGGRSLVSILAQRRKVYEV